VKGSVAQLVSTRFAIIIIDETDMWAEHIQKRAGRLFGIYLANLNEQTYCCELTPSYECHWVKADYTVSPDEKETEALKDDVLMASGTNEPVSYFYKQLVDSFPNKTLGEFPSVEEKGCIILMPDLDDMVGDCPTSEISYDELVEELND